jgi:hypothetical protein
VADVDPLATRSVTRENEKREAQGYAAVPALGAQTCGWHFMDMFGRPAATAGFLPGNRIPGVPTRRKTSQESQSVPAFDQFET